MHLGENLAMSVRIGSKLPISVMRGLIEYLRANTDLFVISLDEIPDIDPNVACHHLNIDPSIRYVDQRRRRQSLEKFEATMNTI